MKYIRTKNGIYKGNEDWYRQHYCFEPILKQADTIEELCDEFVCEWNVYPTLSIALKRVPKDKQKEIYGAIWTDKGLIYVAKMNDEGELELL